MKKGKTKKIVALASVLALSCTCGAAALVPNAYEAPVAVYAEETTKSEEVLAFEKLVQDIVKLESDFIGTDITEDKDIAETVYFANMQYIKVENANKAAQVDEGIYATYLGYEEKFEDMISAASEADKVYDNFKSVLENKDVIYFSEKADYMDAFDFSSFSPAKQEIIDTLGLLTTTRSAKATEMKKYFDAKEEAELAAKAVVDAIDPSIKIASLSAINDAYTKVEAVYGSRNVSAEDSAIIAGCLATLGEYMGKYNELVKAVDDFKAVIEALPASYDKGELQPGYMLEVVKTYNDVLTTEQQEKIGADKVPGTNVSYKDQMGKYYDLATEAEKAAAPVIRAINAIPATDAIAITDEGAIKNARAKYDALEKHGKGYEAYVYNYYLLEAAEAKWGTITEDVRNWEEMITNLLGDREPTEIILEDAEKITDIVDFYENEFSPAMKTYVQSTSAYDTYTEINDTLAGIYKKIEDVSKAYMEIPAVVADYETAIDTYIDEVNAFCAKYEIAKKAYDALTDAEKDYFAEEYADAVAKKASAEADNEVYGVEGLILAIRDENKTTCAQDLKLADAETVKVAYEKYTNFDGEVKALFAAKVEDAYAQIMAIENELDQWIEAVQGIVAADFKLQDITNGSDFVKFFDDIAGFDAEQRKYVAEAIDALDAEGKEIEDNIKAMNDAIAALSGKTTLTAEDRACLDDLATLYAGMHQSQKDLIPYYSDVVESTKERIATAEAFEALIAKIQTVYTKDNYAFVLAVEALYENLDDEIKGLISEEAKEALDEAVASFNADDAVILDIDAIKTDLEGKISTLETALNTAKTELLAADATNKAELLEKITGLQTALNAANANISVLQGKIDALDAAYKAADAVLDGKITGLQTTLNTANANISALQGKIDALDAAYKAADAILEGKITALETALNTAKTDLEGKISALETALNTAKTELLAADATNKAELEGKITALETALNTAKAALEAADAKLKGDLEAADAAIIEDLEAVEAKLDAAKAELEKTIADLETELKAADDANKAELKAEIDALRKSLTTATVILAIVSGLAFAGVVALFVLKFFVKKKD